MKSCAQQLPVQGNAGWKMNETNSQLYPVSNISVRNGAGAVDSTAPIAPIYARGLRGTGICSAPVEPQIARTLLLQARTVSAQSPDETKSAGEESGHYEKEDKITPARKVLKKTD